MPFLPRLMRITGKSRPAGGYSFACGWVRSSAALAWPCSCGAPAHRSSSCRSAAFCPLRDMMLAVDSSGSMETRDFTDASGKTGTC